jgi:hypothetical protein
MTAADHGTLREVALGSLGGIRLTTDEQQLRLSSAAGNGILNQNANGQPAGIFYDAVSVAADGG